MDLGQIGSVGVDIQLDAKTTILLILILCSPVLIYFLGKSILN